jgi:plasmid maintenance system antidote protein VapI
MAVRIAAVMPGPRASTWLSIQAEWDLWQIEKNIDLSQLTPLKIPVSQK